MPRTAVIRECVSYPGLVSTYPAFAVGGRRNGKAILARQATEAAALAGRHVHAAGPGGSWCVTWHPGPGFLWARLATTRQPARQAVPEPGVLRCTWTG